MLSAKLYNILIAYFDLSRKEYTKQYERYGISDAWGRELAGKIFRAKEILETFSEKDGLAVVTHKNVALLKECIDIVYDCLSNRCASVVYIYRFLQNFGWFDCRPQDVECDHYFVYSLTEDQLAYYLW